MGEGLLERPTAPTAAPCTLGSRRLRNRVVLAPMDRNFCEPDGRLTDRYIAYLAERAEGGAALLYPEAAYVRIDGKCQTHQMGLHEDHVVPGLRRLADAVHERGALLGVQLNHGGNTSKPKVSGYRPVSPSGVPCAFAGGFEPDVLEHEDVLDLVAAYAEAAERAVAAGVDVLMVHAAHGYLIHQFLMPRTNRRTDEFGDPVRFLDAVLEAVRAVAPEHPIVLRASILDDPDNGLTPAEAAAIIARARLDLVDGLDLSAGSYERPEWIIPVGERDEGWLEALVAPYRGLGPRISVAGRIATLATADRLLAGGAVDLVSVGRAFHADPRWAAALVDDGPPTAPRPCIACNLCIDELGQGPVRCTVNPRAGHELEIAPDPVAGGEGAAERGWAGGGEGVAERGWVAGGEGVAERGWAAAGEGAAERGWAGGGEGATRRADPVLIVGAGPAGLELARRLALDGRAVRLVERADVVGGQFALAAGLRCYPRYGAILAWYSAELARLGIAVELGVEVDAAWLAEAAPDTIVLATGGRGFLPDVPGLTGPRVHDVRDWLRLGSGGEIDHGPFVVWGGDREGVAVADDLLARGAEVSLVVAGARFSRDVGRMAKALVLERLHDDPRVTVHFDATIRAITPDGVLLHGPGGERSIGGRPTVLVSQGVEARDDLRTAARALGVPGGVHVIGDAGGAGGGFADALGGSVHLAEVLNAATETASARP